MSDVSMAVHYRSGTSEYETPVDLFQRLSRWLGPFDLDVCATPENAKCRRYYTRREDGLAQEWTGTCWMNPPYGAEIGRWIRKAWESSLAGATVVCLVPARTDTVWWHDYVLRYGQVHYLRGRIRFVGAPNRAPFPSAVVVFRPSGGTQ